MPCNSENSNGVACPYRLVLMNHLQGFRGNRGIGIPNGGTLGLATGSPTVPRLRSLDQLSATIFHSPFVCRLKSTRYLPRSSRRLPIATGTSDLQRPAS